MPNFVYLAGPIDLVDNPAFLNWHIETISRLISHDIIGISPLITQAVVRNFRHSSVGLAAMQQNDSYIGISDAVIFNLSSNTPTVGTIQELRTAFDLNIPLRVVINPGGTRSLYMQAQATHIVDTLDEAISIVVNNIGVDPDIPANIPATQPTPPASSGPIVKIVYDPGVKELYEDGFPKHAKTGDVCYDMIVSEDTEILPAIAPPWPWLLRWIRAVSGILGRGIIEDAERSGLLRGGSDWDRIDGVEDDLNGHVYTNVPTGVYVEIPPKTWLEIRPRSSTSRVRQIHVPTATIDEGYRGELFAQAISMNGKKQIVRRGERIAQFRIAPVYDCDFVEVDELSSSERSRSGFGSSGR